MKLKVRIITPNTSANLEEIDEIVLSTLAGQITVLPSHFPLLSGVSATKIEFTKNKEKILAFGSDGIIEVKENEVVLLLDAFEFADQIDEARAKASYDRAMERISSKKEGVDIKRAEASLQRAMARLDVVASTTMTK